MYQPGIGVALVNKYGNKTTYSMTDDYSHFVGEVNEVNGVRTVTDKYGMEIPPNGILYHLMVTGVDKYQEWAARHQ